MPDVVKIAFDVVTLLGPRSIAIDVEDVPTRLAELVPIAQLVTDVMLDAAIAHERDQGRELSCAAGCGACCRQYVAISIPEALYVAEALAQLPADQQSLYAGRMAAIADRLGKEERVDRVLDPTVAPDTIRTLPREYFQLGLPCPFLTDESCSIYLHRPTPCRDHNLTSPPELCRDPYANELRKVPSPLPLTAVLARLTARLVEAPSTLVPLSQVTRAAETHREIDQRTWPGVALVKELLTELARAAS